MECSTTLCSKSQLWFSAGHRGAIITHVVRTDFKPSLLVCWHDLITASSPERIKKQRSLLAGERKPASVRFPTFAGIVFRRLCSKVEKLAVHLLLRHQHSGHRSHPRSTTSTMHPVISAEVRDVEIREGTRGGRSKFLSGNRPCTSWCSLGAF